MRAISPTLERCRVTRGPLASSPSDGANGCFIFRFRGAVLRCIVSDGRDWGDSGLPLPAWEHVSVSLEDRCPTWDEMAQVKKLFWRDDETVVEFHVPKRDHVNFHPNCLHLWRLKGAAFPVPPSITVGPTKAPAEHSQKGKP